MFGDALNVRTFLTASLPFPSIFPRYREQNYFLLPYQKIFHSSFPSFFPISLKYYFLLFTFFFFIHLFSSLSPCLIFSVLTQTLSHRNHHQPTRISAFHAAEPSTKPYAVGIGSVLSGWVFRHRNRWASRLLLFRRAFLLCPVRPLRLIPGVPQVRLSRLI
jgi:hypothetical protein